MAELTDTQIDAALESGRMARETEPRAASARYDERSGRIVVELTNGCTFAFPPRLAQGLEDGAAISSRIEILGQGYGLHWEALDVDLFDSGPFGRHIRHQGFIWRGGRGKRHRRRRQQPRV